MYFLYILKCADKTLYTGITVNIGRRISEHNTSKLGARYTRARRPVSLKYFKKFRSRSKASREEFRIKTLSRKEKLELINNNNLKTYERGSGNKGKSGQFSGNKKNSTKNRQA